MIFILLIYNSADQNVLINDWYACLQVLSKQLTVWNAYLSLLGYNGSLQNLDSGLDWTGLDSGLDYGLTALLNYSGSDQCLSQWLRLSR